MFKVPEIHRKTRGDLSSTIQDGNNGCFIINRGRTEFFILASDGLGWEHVSIHCKSEGKERTPTWAEMCFVKGLFWDKTDCVVQYHPPESEYVNLHKHTLHLWRQVGIEFPIPENYLV